MTRRTRSVLIDGNLGRMYSNVNNSSIATADKVIAGSKPATSITYLKPKSSPLTVVNATKGTRFGSSGLITSITYKFDGDTPAGRPVNVRLRKVSSNGTSTNIATYSLAIGVSAGTITTDSISIAAGDSFFWDVTQIGIGRPGSGLFITKTYYLTG
jgi:hypothetical protein